jgi:hypothetical protein
MKQTLKQLILDKVEKDWKNQARFTDIIEFAHDHKHGAGSWKKNPNRRGWYSGAFCRQAHVLSIEKPHVYVDGYLIKKGIKSGWLEKQTNRRYKTVRYSK